MKESDEDKRIERLKTERRFKILAVMPEVLIEVFKTNYIPVSDKKKNDVVYQVVDGIPENAIIHRVSYDFPRDAICFLVMDESFDKVPHSQIAPYMDVQLKSIRPEVKVDPSLHSPADIG